MDYKDRAEKKMSGLWQISKPDATLDFHPAV